MNAAASGAIDGPIDATVKAQFPLLERRVHNHPIVYLDSAASSQKPTAVLDAMDDYYRSINANVHRGAYEIAAAATEEMERARADVARFIGAPSADDIVFTKNATEAMNLVARSWGGSNLGPADAVVLTEMEHHANIVPWHILAAERGFEIRWIPITHDGCLDLTDLDRLLDGAKLLSVTAMSNVLGTLNPISRLAAAAHDAGALISVDASQYVPHLPTDVGELGADFMVFTGHKMWRADRRRRAVGSLGTAGRDATVPRRRRDDPRRHQGGLPPQHGAAQVRGRHAADRGDRGPRGCGAIPGGAGHGRRASARGQPHRLRPADADRPPRRRHHRARAVRAGTARRRAVVRVPGRAPARTSLRCWTKSGVCVRAGHHCAKPLMRCLGVTATTRASLYVYNDSSDVDSLADALDEVGALFGL